MLTLQASGYLVGFTIAAVRVTDGTLVKTEDMSSLGQGGGTFLRVTIAPGAAGRFVAGGGAGR